MAECSASSIGFNSLNQTNVTMLTELTAAARPQGCIVMAQNTTHDPTCVPQWSTVLFFGHEHNPLLVVRPCRFGITADRIGSISCLIPSPASHPWQLGSHYNLGFLGLQHFIV